MSSVERPLSDPVRLLDHWREAKAGDITPGRVVANLKQAGMPDFLSTTLIALQDAGVDTDAIAALVEAWGEWERGKLPPQPLLDALSGGGIEGFFERSVAAQEEAFGSAPDVVAADGEGEAGVEAGEPPAGP